TTSRSRKLRSSLALSRRHNSVGGCVRTRCLRPGSPSVADSGSIQKRSVIIAGHRTSVSLEPEFWSALKDIAQQRGVALNELVSEIERGRCGSLSGALRVFVLPFLQGRLAAAAEPRDAATLPTGTEGTG